jgi:hypothetical protein
MDTRIWTKSRRSKEDGMSWDISISHEESDDRTRLVIEASPDVPEMVISVLAGSYWEEEVRFADDWEEEEFDTFDEEDLGPGGGLHG